MITTWREMLPSPPQQREPARPDPHIWDEITLDQNSSMAKSAEALKTIVTAIIDHLPAEQQSTFKNYQATREHSGNSSRMP